MQEFNSHAGVLLSGWNHLARGGGQGSNLIHFSCMHMYIYIALFGCRLHERHMDASRGKVRVDAMVGC